MDNKYLQYYELNFIHNYFVYFKANFTVFLKKYINSRLTCPIMVKPLTQHMLSWRDNNWPIFFCTIIVDWQKNYLKNHISLLNLVNSSWLWKIGLEITATQRWRIFLEHLNKVYLNESMRNIVIRCKSRQRVTGGFQNVISISNRGLLEKN